MKVWQFKFKISQRRSKEGRGGGGGRGGGSGGGGRGGGGKNPTNLLFVQEEADARAESLLQGREGELTRETSILLTHTMSGRRYFITLFSTLTPYCRAQHEIRLLQSYQWKGGAFPENRKLEN